MIRASAAILAGGDSKRMGRNKALLKIDDRTLIEIIVSKVKPVFQETIIVTHLKEAFQELGLGRIKYTEDLPLGIKKNALRGIYSAIKVSNNHQTFVVACDMPFIDSRLIDYMSAYAVKYDVVIPKIRGHFQPLHGYYGKRCALVIEEMLAAEEFKISQLYEKVEVKIVDEWDLKKLKLDETIFLNINNQDEYKKALKIHQVSNLLEGDAPQCLHLKQ